MEFEIELLESKLMLVLFVGPGQQGPEEREDQFCVSDRACGQDGAAGQQHQEADIGAAQTLRGGRYPRGASLHLLLNSSMEIGCWNCWGGLYKFRVVPKLLRPVAVSFQGLCQPRCQSSFALCYSIDSSEIPQLIIPPLL